MIQMDFFQSSNVVYATTNPPQDNKWDKIFTISKNTVNAFICFLMVLGFEHRALKSLLLNTCFTSELCSQPSPEYLTSLFTKQK